MAFSYDLTKVVGQVRLAIGDTVEHQGPRPQERNFSDAELTYFYSAEGTVGRAVARAFETLAAEWSTYTDFTLGPRKEQLGRIAYKYMQLAELQRKIHGGGSISFATGLDRQDGYAEEADAATSEFS